MILAGGASRRAGGAPKGLQRVGGLRIVDRVAAALAKVTDEVLLVANAPEAAGWLPGVPVVPDLRPGRGGLAGIEAALAARSADVLIVAWDMPFVTAPLLAALAERAAVDAASVVVPESDAPHGFEPFCAWYGMAVAAALTAYLDEGGSAAHEFFTRVTHALRLPRDQVARYGDPTALFFSVNTPDDLARARARVERTERQSD